MGKRNNSGINRKVNKLHSKRNGNSNMVRAKMSNPLRNQFSRSHMIVPPVFRTTCGIDYFGSHAAGISRLTFAVSANSAHLPFNSALVAANGITINAAGFSPYTGSVYTTMQPQGFSNLCGSAATYLNYRVLGSKIKLRLIPTAGQDSIVATVNQVSTGEQWNTSVWTGAEAPYASRARTFTNSESNGAIVQKFSSAEAFGVPVTAITDGVEYAGSFNTSPENEWNWIVNMQSINNNTSGVMGILIEVEYEIEFWNPVTGGLNDTLLKRKVIGVGDVADSSSTPIIREEPDYLIVGGKKFLATF